MLCLLMVLTALAQTPRASLPSGQALGTKRMAERLAQIYRQQDFRTDPNKDRERAEYYREGLKQPLDLRTELKARMALADALLKAGDSAAAVSELESLRQMMKEKGVIPAEFFVNELRQLLAISYLRLGEQENCVLNHGLESCIFPIRASAQHKLPRGATGAIRELTGMLNSDPNNLPANLPANLPNNLPNNLNARWLLNIAQMVLGEHSQKVAPEWLIPTERFNSDYDIGRFADVAPQLGLDVTGRAGGSVMEDFDGDGLLDLMISSSGPLDQLRFFKNNGDGSFTERTNEAGLTGITGGLNLIHADFNNDGWPDALVLRGGWWAEHGCYPPSLLKNNGNGTFDDVTEEAGLLSFHPTQTAAWADYDNDGWLDVFIGHESNDKQRHPSQLFHNNRNGTFTEVGEKMGLADLGFVKGVAWGDYNNDGRADLYVSVKGAKNRLFRNDGPVASRIGRREYGTNGMNGTNRKLEISQINSVCSVISVCSVFSLSPTQVEPLPQPKIEGWKFTDVTDQAGVAEPLHSFATWFWDYDNDGWQDIFVAGYYSETLNDIGAFLLGQPHKAELPRLYHNNKDGTFTEVSRQMKLDRVILPMGANFGDLDNDGWLDCYFGTGTPQFEALLPNKMFRNAGGKAFQDVTTSGGFGHLQKGHAVSFGDIDNDGDEDIFEVIGGALAGDTYQSVLFENPGHGNRWLTLELRGTKTNASAIGARLRIRVKTKSGSRDIFRAITSGGSFGDSPFRLHAGLGDALAIDEVEIRWPVTGQSQTLRNLTLDQSYRLREGDSKPEILGLKRFSLSGKTKPAHHQ